MGEPVGIVADASVVITSPSFSTELILRQNIPVVNVSACPKSPTPGEIYMYKREGVGVVGTSESIVISMGAGVQYKFVSTAFCCAMKAVSSSYELNSEMKERLNEVINQYRMYIDILTPNVERFPALNKVIKELEGAIELLENAEKVNTAEIVPKKLSDLFILTALTYAYCGRIQIAEFLINAKDPENTFAGFVNILSNRLASISESTVLAKDVFIIGVFALVASSELNMYGIQKTIEASRDFREIEKKVMCAVEELKDATSGTKFCVIPSVKTQKKGENKGNIIINAVMKPTMFSTDVESKYKEGKHRELIELIKRQVSRIEKLC